MPHPTACRAQGPPRGTYVGTSTQRYRSKPAQLSRGPGPPHSLPETARCAAGPERTCVWGRGARASGTGELRARQESGTASQFLGRSRPWLRPGGPGPPSCATKSEGPRPTRPGQDSRAPKARSRGTVEGQPLFPPPRLRSPHATGRGGAEQDRLLYAVYNSFYLTEWVALKRAF